MENDESFEKYIIEEDAGDDSNDGNEENKENLHVIISRQSNTKPQQIQKITESTEGMSEKRLNKKYVSLFWDKLTIELNEMGPPVHSSMEWRRVWSLHKSNRKRKHSGSNPVQSPQAIEYGQILDKLDQILEKQKEINFQWGAKVQSSQVLSSAMQSSDGRYGPLEQILDKLNQVIDKQNEIISRSDAFDQILDKLNQQNEVVNQSGVHSSNTLR